jgi:hypothetical protein
MVGFDGEGLGDEEKQAALADWLRDQGCAVWQNSTTTHTGHPGFGGRGVRSRATTRQSLDRAHA